MRSGAPWWARELADVWVTGQPVPPKDVVEATLAPPGREPVQLAYRLGPAVIGASWAVKGQQDGWTWYTKDLGCDLVGAVRRMATNPSWWNDNGNIARLSPETATPGAPWWAAQLGEVLFACGGEIPGLVEEEFLEGRIAYVLQPSARRWLHWTVRRGVVLDDGAWCSSVRMSQAADADPLAVIKAYIERPDAA